MSKRDRSILAVLAGAIALAAFWFVVLGPKRAEGEKLDADVAAAQQRLATAQSTVTVGTAAKAGYASNAATIARLGTAVPTDDDLPSLLYQVQASAKGADVDFGALERGDSDASAPGTAGAAGAATSQLPPGAVVGTAGFAMLPFSFTFTGSYFSLEHLIDDLHGYVRANGDKVSVRGRLLTVDGFSMTAGDGGLSHISAKVTASAYLIPGTATSSGSTPTTTPSTGTAAPAGPTSSAITGGAS